MPITAGSISVARRINIGDYNHKEAKAEVHYVVEAGDDPSALMDAARYQAVRQLAQAVDTVVKFHGSPEVELGAPESVKSGQVEQAEEQKKRHRRTKAEMEAVRAAETPPADPTPASVPSDTAETTGVAEATATAEITDKELNNACNETMNRIKNKVAIQGIIQRYTDGVVSTIPQAERAKFLTELKVL